MGAGARAEPPPEATAAGEEPAEEEAVEDEAVEEEAPEAEAAPAEAEPDRRVLAEFGANMPSEVHLDDTVPVEVLLSRGEVQVFAGTTHDEQLIVMDPNRPLDVVLLRRGFDLDDREVPHDRAGAASGCRRKVGLRYAFSSGCAPPRRGRARYTRVVPR